VYVHVDAPPHGVRATRLPDETQVILSPGSHLSYSNWFAPHDERELTLNGEGTFAVARGAREAMTVRGAGVEVSASNARFTIHAYDSEPIAYVVVQEGRAEVRARTAYDTTKSVTLGVGEAARVGPNLQIKRDDSLFALHR
jgi:ferric-dicitrate binding protein FerR (iron transport regulator)